MLQVKVPSDFDFSKVSGLSNEIVEKLTKIQPPTLFSASQISGVTPASLDILHIYLKDGSKRYLHNIFKFSSHYLWLFTSMHIPPWVEIGYNS